MARLVLLLDLYHIIGTLQGYATGLEIIEKPALEALREGLVSCSETLETIASELRRMQTNVGIESTLSP